MKRLSLIIIAVVWPMVTAGYTPYNPRNNQEYLGSIGSECEYDVDCETQNSYCRSNRVCDCMKKFEYDERQDECVPTQLGLQCSSQSDCPFQNSRCLDKKCSCQTGHTSKDGDKECIRIAKLMASCEEDLQCKAADENSHCNVTSKVCDCNTNFHTAYDTQQCTPNKRLRDTCSTHAECASTSEQQDKVECRPDAQRRPICQCKEGFAEANRICTRGRDGGAATMFLSMTALVVSVAFYILH